MNNHDRNVKSLKVAVPISKFKVVKVFSFHSRLEHVVVCESTIFSNERWIEYRTAKIYTAIAPYLILQEKKRKKGILNITFAFSWPIQVQLESFGQMKSSDSTF